MRRALLVLCACAVLHAEPGFKKLFNGKNLDGWTGDPRLWKVERGEIAGSTDGVTLDDNSFLAYTKREYSDFILRAKIKLRNHNSGIQFRSERVGQYAMRGYQADAAEGNWWGSIYDEKGKREVLVNGWTGKAERVVKPNDWNDVEIYAKGDQLRITVNGLVTSELKDSALTRGLIGLQLHKGPGMQVRFKDVVMKELK